MALLKQEIQSRGIQGGIPNPDEETTIRELDPQALLELQAVFTQLLVTESPRLTQLVNQTAPVLFATLLFMACQEFAEDPEDDEVVIATKDALEAEAGAIGLIRSVAAAFGKAEGTITVEPSDAEIDADTELAPV